jgi:Protein of unknown function (DUF2917)
MTAVFRSLLAALAPRLGAAAHGLAHGLARLGSALAPPSRPLTATLRHLDKGITIRVSRPLGRHVRCDTGTLWLTFEQVPMDVVLEAGEEHLCVHDAALSIHVLSTAVVQVF